MSSDHTATATATATAQPEPTPGLALAHQLLELAGASGLSIATAESLTAGLLAARLVDVPGASRVFRGGIVAYDTALKHSLLGVDAALLSEAGPVDPRVAVQLAEGVRAACAIDGRPADVGIATTGVAGPDRQNGHAVGEVYVAVSSSAGVRVEQHQCHGDRAEIRTQTVLHALRLAIATLSAP